jgi:hypothetical protein
MGRQSELEVAVVGWIAAAAAAGRRRKMTAKTKQGVKVLKNTGF